MVRHESRGLRVMAWKSITIDVFNEGVDRVGFCCVLGIPQPYWWKNLWQMYMKQNLVSGSQTTPGVEPERRRTKQGAAYRPHIDGRGRHRVRGRCLPVWKTSFELQTSR